MIPVFTTNASNFIVMKHLVIDIILRLKYPAGYESSFLLLQLVINYQAILF